MQTFSALMTTTTTGLFARSTYYLAYCNSQNPGLLMACFSYDFGIARKYANETRKGEEKPAVLRCHVTHSFYNAAFSFYFSSRLGLPFSFSSFLHFFYQPSFYSFCVEIGNWIILMEKEEEEQDGEKNHRCCPFAENWNGIGGRMES